MLSLPRPFIGSLILVLCCGSFSCKKAGPPLAATSGVVTYKGLPVAGAQVVFMSVEKFDGRHWPASAETDGEGQYVLETPGVGQGALLGKHSVSITKRGPSPGAIPGSPAVGNESRPELQAYLRPGPPLIPKKYFSPVTSGLEPDVQPGNNTWDFDLQD